MLMWLAFGSVLQQVLRVLPELVFGICLPCHHEVWIANESGRPFVPSRRALGSGFDSKDVQLEVANGTQLKHKPTANQVERLPARLFQARPNLRQIDRLSIQLESLGQKVPFGELGLNGSKREFGVES